MLTLPELEIAHPRSFAEAVALLSAAGGQAMPLAGGTDLVPNLKHRLFSPAQLVDLKSISEGREVDVEGAPIRLGALCTLDALASHAGLRSRLPALCEAAGLVAGPQLRRMGTLGGNVCLDTRCVYYNQTYFWRSALGFCLKKDGTLCHVVKSGKRCVAAASNDTAPVLLALGARLVIVSSAGEREVALDDFYLADGIKNTRLEPGELVRAVLVDPPAPGTLMAYEKLRTRKAIDYPLLSLALVLRLDDGGRVAALRVVVSALAARPRSINGLEAWAVGLPPGPELVERLAEQVHRQTHPLTNILSDTEWRREMAPVLLRRAFRRALARRG